MVSVYKTDKGIWNGWYWRFGGLSIAIIVVLQLLAKYLAHYPVITSAPLALLMVAYLIAPRVKERRLANTLAGVIVIFVIDLLLQVFLEGDLHAKGMTLLFFVQTNIEWLMLGLITGFLYLKLTQWSEKKRAQTEAKRHKEAVASRPTPVRRHHRKKRK